MITSKFSRALRHGARAGLLRPYVRCAMTYPQEVVQQSKDGSGRGTTGIPGKEQYVNECYGLDHQLKQWYHLQDYDQNNYVANKVLGYTFVNFNKAIWASGLQTAVIKIVGTFDIPANEMAAAKLEVDLSDIEVGKIAMVQWKGTPVFVFHRNAEQIAQARAGDSAQLRDNESDAARRNGPEHWLVVIGICTHLGCIPVTLKGDYGAFFCPCHGSHYDSSGRIRVGPAPLNLEVPKHKFLDEKTLLIG